LIVEPATAEDVKNEADGDWAADLTVESGNGEDIMF
jgi:hypothetical protein